MATLSEADSKALLSAHGLPLLDERIVSDISSACEAARDLGYPCVIKLCGDSIAHKTERNLVRLALSDEAAVEVAATELLAAARPEDGKVSLLVAPMVRSNREFIVGAQRSDEFGAIVMLGIGGILAEALEDITFRMLPADDRVFDDMIDDLQLQELIAPFRGEPGVDRTALVAVVRSVANAMLADPSIMSIDVNPVLVPAGAPVAVDALVERSEVASAG